jgi:hypothetical protein
VHRTSTRVAGALIAIAVFACSSIGPPTVRRDRIDYMTAIGEAWKQHTLLNIVKLRYGDLRIFVEVAQVIAGHQFQSILTVGFNASNFTASTVGPFTVGEGAPSVGAGEYLGRRSAIG